MRTMRWRLVSVCLLLVVASHDLRAQGFQGALRGLVKDAGGVVPGADVTLVNEGTSVSRSTISNEAGEYSFPNVPPGTYG